MFPAEVCAQTILSPHCPGQQFKLRREKLRVTQFHGQLYPVSAQCRDQIPFLQLGKCFLFCVFLNLRCLSILDFCCGFSPCPAPKEFFLISSMFFVYPSADPLTMTKGVLLSLRLETFHSQDGGLQWRDHGQNPCASNLTQDRWPGWAPVNQSAAQSRMFAQLGSVWG